jgi:hypothetical protein
MVREIGGMIKDFEAEAAKLTSDKEFAKYIKNGITKTVMEKFKVDKATAELATDEIKNIGYNINDLKKNRR